MDAEALDVGSLRLMRGTPTWRIIPWLVDPQNAGLEDDVNFKGMIFRFYVSVLGAVYLEDRAPWLGYVVNNHGDRKSPKYSCSSSKWPFLWLINGGDPNYLLTGQPTNPP